jgi:hypothetical protein
MTDPHAADRVLVLDFDSQAPSSSPGVSARGLGRFVTGGWASSFGLESAGS